MTDNDQFNVKYLGEFFILNDIDPEAAFHACLNYLVNSAFNSGVTPEGFERITSHLHSQYKKIVNELE